MFKPWRLFHRGFGWFIAGLTIANVFIGFQMTAQGMFWLPATWYGLLISAFIGVEVYEQYQLNALRSRAKSKGVFNSLRSARLRRKNSKSGLSAEGQVRARPQRVDLGSVSRLASAAQHAKAGFSRPGSQIPERKGSGGNRGPSLETEGLLPSADFGRMASAESSAASAIGIGDDPSTEDSDLPTMTVSHFYESVESGDEYTIVNDFVVDIGGFASRHPGSSAVIQRSVGKDITEYFFGEARMDKRLAAH